MSSSRWPPYVRRNARATIMISSLVISSASSSAHQFLVSPQYFRFGLNSGVIRRRHRRWYVPPTKRRCCTTKPLLRASVGESDIYNADELEEEILEFMVNSENPELFPSKKELVDAGRDDLVDAIVNQGGLLNRLEKQRNYALELDQVRENEDHTFPASYHNAEVDWKYSRFSTDANNSFSSGDGLRNSNDHHEPQMWRSWSIQRAGFRDIDTEDIESAPSEASNIGGSSTENSKDEITRVESSSSSSSAEEAAAKYEWNELGSRIEKRNHDRFIRSRLQQLELEASAVLRSVRLNITNEFASQKLYDDWEFWEVQDDEITKAEDKLRSTRSKLAVLEGKMALAIIDARQVMDEKKKKIDDARRALRLVHSTCVVWPNSASSEVFLAGSFDGWATQV
ncbi:hypothetical protein TIFTF001_010980 [Ficus carica]|uniref:Uncharacterized protein n=1 Tax=Ficus carica TaxID=3494 RepID=A0AA87ZWD1_FICCA|nr:hypothetical protein TIFTF001_010980 [Ficus carica]